MTAWNPGAEHLYGYAASEMIGQSITRVVPADRIDVLTDLLARLGRGERITHFETERVTKDGGRIAISISAAPLIDDHGRPVGAAKIAHDITDRRRAEAGAVPASWLDVRTTLANVAAWTSRSSPTGVLCMLSKRMAQLPRSRSPTSIRKRSPGHRSCSDAIRTIRTHREAW